MIEKKTVKANNTANVRPGDRGRLKTNAEILDERRDMPPAKSGRPGVLDAFAAAEPHVAAKIAEALETGRYFITVTFQKKYNPDDAHDMHHIYTRKGLDPNDVTGSLRHLLKDYNSKENPNAVTDSAEGGLY